MSHYCDYCDIYFCSWHALQQHWIQSPQHDYCQRCDEHFDDDGELEEHYDECHFWCRKCRRFFKHMRGLMEHYRQSQMHHYCLSCHRDFQSESNLRAHLNSSLHKPKDFGCPLRGCGLAFVSASALTQHMESGTCASGIDRDGVNRIVRQYDKSNVITDPSRMITAGGSGQQSKFYATSRAWNGMGYECYLCHKTCRTLAALNQHLASPRHQDQMYICPLNTCRIRFRTLSGLCQHIESESCGVSKFRVVQNTMENLIGNMKRITF